MRIVPLALVALLSAPLAACEREAPPPPRPRFVERLAGSGIAFEHHFGRSGQKLFPEVGAAGASLLDYDGDGDLDVWFAQGGPLPGCPDMTPQHDQLWRNDGGFRFTDVTKETGTGEPGFSYSASAADVDGDGDADLFICNLGHDVLLVNDGHGRFTDVTKESGLDSPLWTSCAAFADLDGDGDLDCYAGNYVEFDLEHPRVHGEVERGPEYRAYAHPDNYTGSRNELFRNDGGRDGAIRFTNVTDAAGMAKALGKALAVVPVDYDDDGDVDLYVANDHVANFLWRNDTKKGGPIALVDVARDVGVALDGEGRAESCMGSDAADVDNDGDFDLFSANMVYETNTLYVNQGGWFSDDTALAGLGHDSYMFVGFGAKFFDQDLDGDLDLALANGHVIDNVALYDANESFAQLPHFYENLGHAKFRLVREGAGPYFQEQHVGRGLAAGDLDGDGDLDLVYANWGERPEILENTAIQTIQGGDGGRGPRWIGLSLRAKGANTQAIGARVWCEAGGRKQVAEVRGTGSYNAWNDTRLVFALGAPGDPPKIIVRWPDGSMQTIEGLAAGRYHAIAQQ